MTKRLGNIWRTLISYDNVKLAYQNARKGKSRRPDVQMVDANPDHYIREVCRLRDPQAQYYLKIDIRKFFPSIDKDVMMAKIETRVKDPDVLDLCRRIIYEYPLSGLPIGNYTSQYFANFYLSDLDHYMKEVYHCRWYLRYMDDIVVLGWSKPWLRRVLARIRDVITPWGLEVKENWCIRPVTEGIDWVGYVTYPDHCILRKRTKLRLKRACRRIRRRWAEGHEPDAHDRGVLAAYNGCLKWCDGYYLGAQTVYPLLEECNGNRSIEI